MDHLRKNHLEFDDSFLKRAIDELQASTEEKEALWQEYGYEGFGLEEYTATDPMSAKKVAENRLDWLRRVRERDRQAVLAALRAMEVK